MPQVSNMSWIFISFISILLFFIIFIMISFFIFNSFKKIYIKVFIFKNFFLI